MPHHPTQLGAHTGRQRLGKRVLVGGCVHADLDQLVVAQRGVDRGEHAGARAALAHQHEGLQRVGPGAQEAALESLQSAAARVAHAAHSTRARALGLLQSSLIALALSFGVACAATTAPPALIAEAPVPRATAQPKAHPPVALTEATDTKPASLLDSAPPESESLHYARVVLGARGDRLDAVQREGVARALANAELEYGLPVLMTLAMIEQESRFDPHAKGPTGSLGLMQVQPQTARDVARRHGLAWQSDRTLYDPVQNVRIATAYLGEMRQRFGTLDHAIAAFNIGPGALERLIATRPLRHGPYLKKIHAHASALSTSFGSAPELAIGG